MGAARGTLAERFWPKVDVRGPEECWPWLASGLPTGYGMIRLGGSQRKEYAHRVAFFLTHGRWPTVGRHTCDNPPCANPGHVIDGTHVDNMQDSISRGRFNHGSRGRSKPRKVTAEQVATIVERHQAGDTYKAIAADFPISDVQARNIVLRYGNQGGQ